MGWQVQYAQAVVKRFLPFEQQIRSFKRRVFGHTHNVSETVCSGGFDQLKILADEGLDVHGKTVLEVGSGWLPMIPLMYRAAGADRVLLTDMDRLMDHTTLEIARGFLVERAEWVGNKLGVDAEAIRQRLQVAPGTNFEETLETLGLSYHVSFDYKSAEQTIDIVCSHTVLEHISKDALLQLLKDWKRILKPGGVILHGIDHSDHRANVDAELSRIDFLRYSDWAWRVLTLNPQDYCNRLRHSEYMQMIDRAGYEILLERPWVSKAAMRDLENGLPLADKFNGVAFDDLAMIWTYVLAR